MCLQDSSVSFEHHRSEPHPFHGTILRITSVLCALNKNMKKEAKKNRETNKEQENNDSRSHTPAGAEAFHWWSLEGFGASTAPGPKRPSHAPSPRSSAARKPSSQGKRGGHGAPQPEAAAPGPRPLGHGMPQICLAPPSNTFCRLPKIAAITSVTA